MAHITNVSEQLARHILGQYRMTDDQITYALDFARECYSFEGEHNGCPLKITSDGHRFTITR
jgi:hypothetical protein